MTFAWMALLVPLVLAGGPAGEGIPSGRTQPSRPRISASERANAARAKAGLLPRKPPRRANPPSARRRLVTVPPPTYLGAPVLAREPRVKEPRAVPLVAETHPPRPGPFAAPHEGHRESGREPLRIRARGVTSEMAVLLR